MLVTPSKSVRTVKPATAVTNHMKVRRRENAGRNNKDRIPPVNPQ